MTKEFQEKFWKEALEDPFGLIINGNGYHVAPEVGDPYWRGFAGRKFKIEVLEDTPAYKKGTIIETTNLWHRGEVPKWLDVKKNARTTDDSPAKL